MNHFYREEENKLMDDADVDLFLVLNHNFEPEYLFDEAREEAMDPSEGPREIIMSVGNEIEYPISRHPSGSAMVLVEEGIPPNWVAGIAG